MLHQEYSLWYCHGCGKPCSDNYCEICRKFLDSLAGVCYECGRPMPEDCICDLCKALERDIKPELVQ